MTDGQLVIELRRFRARGGKGSEDVPGQSFKRRFKARKDELLREIYQREKESGAQRVAV